MYGKVKVFEADGDKSKSNITIVVSPQNATEDKICTNTIELILMLTIIIVIFIALIAIKYLLSRFSMKVIKGPNKRHPS